MVPGLLEKYQGGAVKPRGVEQSSVHELYEIEGGDDLSVSASEVFRRENWSDGLPIVAPTQERVQAMLDTVPLHPEHVLGTLPPRGGLATVLKVAVCSVMAGCSPRHFPLVVAAVKGIATPQFKLHSIQSTAHPHSPFIVVNGPAGKTAGLSTGHDCTPQGWSANLAVCRAVRLVTINMAGLKDVVASHTQGFLGRFVDAIRENEEESPWVPYHSDFGYSAEQSSVTVFPGEAPHVVDDRGSTAPQSLLSTFARVMANAGNRTAYGPCEQLILIAPEHARHLGTHGYSREDVRDFLYHVARVPMSEFPEGLRDSFSAWHKKLFWNVSGHVTLPLVQDKNDIKVVVYGGIGPHSMYVPGSLSSKAVTIEVEAKG